MIYKDLFKDSSETVEKKKRTFLTDEEIRKMLKGKYIRKAVYGDDPRKRKEDRDFFNPKEEYEVISMINDVLIEIKSTERLDVNRIEELIKIKPAYIRKRQEVKDWLVIHMKRYI